MKKRDFIGNAIKKVEDFLIGLLPKEQNMCLYFNGMVNRPIGLLTYNYSTIKDNLYSNIGNGQHDFDGYGTPIGGLANIELNSETLPWFFKNKDKNSYQDYLDYIDSIYYGGDGTVINGLDGELNMRLNNPILDTTVGAIRGYDVYAYSSHAKNLVSNGALNPNKNGSDTYLGVINNYYLNSTLENSFESSQYAKSGSYSEPTYGEKNKLIKNSFSITQGAYSYFAPNGDYGIINDGNRVFYGKVLKQSEITGQIIPWSTSDHWYDSSTVVGGSINNVDAVKTLLGTDSDSITQQYIDKTQGVNNNYLYGAFGNYYSITYSLGLTQTAGYQTQKFIVKSMFGYDLLDETYDNIIDFKFDDGDAGEHRYKTGKKYYVGLGTRGSNYIDNMTAIDVSYDTESIIIDGKSTEVPIRLKLIDAGNDNLWSTKALYTYAEAGKPNVTGSSLNAGVSIATYNNGINFGRSVAYDINVTQEKEDIINYTNQKFLKGKYDTLIARFHGDEFESIAEARGNRDMLSTAISQYGMSRGRNLLRKGHGFNDAITQGEGYDNPYCRTWTFHHQYSKLSDTMRPFGEGEYTPKGELSTYGVKGSNGLLRVAPSSSDDIKRCMFSIENLAWKNSLSSNDVLGPNKGKIMWFPPYDLKFDESANVNWNATQFIGRGESIYSYTNTERSGRLSFKLLIDHPSAINGYAGQVRGGYGIGDVDDTESSEQMLLRFFAGCEVLGGKHKVNTLEKKVTPTNVKLEVSTPKMSYENVYFYVFFPNNYGGEDDSADGDVRPMWYLVNGIGTQVTDKNIPTDLTVLYKTFDGNRNVGGYEMVKDYGVTVAPLGGTSLSEIITTLKAYETCDPNEEALPIGEVTLKSIIKKNKNGKNNFWQYRIDSRTATEVLAKPSGKSTINNYVDSNSFQLNSKGYTSLTKYHTDADAYLKDGKLYSFADVFYALEEDSINLMTMRNLCDTDKANVFSSLIKEYDVANVTICGFASKHGTNNSNRKLAQARGNSVKAWLCQVLPEKFAKEKIKVKISNSAPTLSHHDVNKIDAKAWRCARVEIKLQKETIETREEPKRQDNINYYDNNVATQISDAISTISSYGKDALNSLTKIQSIATRNQIENNNAETVAGFVDTNNAFRPGSTENEGEYQYFKDLQSTDPLLHDKIVEKIQYFDPAFHSITPEGFNARLTFLQQCTRQGSTASLSDGGQNSMSTAAGNLSFGTPPICVLRIGDFYNTRIIIDSLNISYDGASWDLNDEGIGVMPMMADVSISFKFLGGSDISGPIKQLQNAVSFNYYANTSVYDGYMRAKKFED